VQRHARAVRAFAERTGATLYRQHADELLAISETA
jgi:hypothetical protein